MKKMITLLLALVLCLNLCACGGGETEENPYEKYAKYEELFNALENGDYDGAINYIEGHFGVNGDNGGSDVSDTEATDATEDPAQVALRQQYTFAIEQLKIYIEHGYVRFYNDAGEEETFQNHDAAQKLYDEFVVFGDYELAPQIVSRFSKLEDVLLMRYKTSVDAFGQQSEPQNHIYYFCDQGDHILYTSENKRTDYTYNEKGQLVAKESVYGDRTEYRYNEENLLVEEKNLNGEKVSYITTYTYDEFGNVLTEEVRRSDGSVTTTKYTYTYDDQNRIESHIWAEYDKDGKLGSHQISPFVCAYDENGNLIMETLTDGNRIYQMVYQYDDQGRLTEKITRNGETDDAEENLKILEKKTYVYENGYLVQEITEQDTVVTLHYQYGMRYAFDPEGLELP